MSRCPSRHEDVGEMDERKGPGTTGRSASRLTHASPCLPALARRAMRERICRCACATSLARVQHELEPELVSGRMQIARVVVEG